MGFYLRKSIKVGPIRFNLSKSGIGVSAGITGFRVGTGPRGNYVHMGRGGVYYRRTLPSGNARPTPSTPSTLQPANFDGTPSTVGPMVEIESADTAQMSDSSSIDLLRELQDKKDKTRLAPIVIVGAAVALGVGLETGLDRFAFVAVAIASAVAVFLSWRRDILAKTVVLFYAFDAELEKGYAALHDGASTLAASAACWHVAASGKVYDRRYHAGASALLDRKPTKIAHTAPPFLKTNIDTVSIRVGRQTIYLFPDRALVYESGRVSAIGYHQLKLSVTQTRFIEDSAPSDARVVDRTWRYVNKDGSPDRRFSNNRELPVCLYDELHFTSSTGLNEIIQVSRCDVGRFFEAALIELRTQISSEALPPAAESGASAGAVSEIKASPGNGRRVAVVCATLVGVGIFVGIASGLRHRQFQPPHPRATAAPTTTPAASASAPISATPRATTPIAASSTPARAQPRVQSSTQPSSPWLTKTTRAVRAKAGAREIFIPKGAQLRVVGRSATDVLVSYGGSTVTVPTSATDLK